MKHLINVIKYLFFLVLFAKLTEVSIFVVCFS